MKKILTILFFLIAVAVNAQYTTKDTTIAGYLVRISYMDGWTDSTECIFSMNGAGEYGTGTAYMANEGPHYWMDHGFSGAVELGNGTHYPVYVTLQRINSETLSPFELKVPLDIILTRFKVKKNSLYGTCFSQGNNEVMGFATYQPTLGDYTYCRYFKAIIDIQGIGPANNWPGSDGTPAYPDRLKAWRDVGGRMWGLEQINDSRSIKKLVDTMNKDQPTPLSTFHYTNFGDGGHDNFEKPLDPDQRNWTRANVSPYVYNVGGKSGTFTGPDINMNAYEWLLRQGDTTLPKAGEEPELIASAGLDKVITLPTNNTTVSGSGSSGATSFLWSKESGPADYVINTPTSAVTSISALTEGVYVFKLTVSNGTTTADDNVTVTVLPIPPPPFVGGKTIVGLGEYQLGFIDPDGHLWGLGRETNRGGSGTGDPAIPERCLVEPFDLKFKFVAGGLHGMGAIDTAGYVWQMGENLQGQHGMGDSDDVRGPRKILLDSAGNPFTNVKEMAAFYSTSKSSGGWWAIKDDSTLWAWGNLKEGMRGNGVNTTELTTRPVEIEIPGSRKAKQIVLGQSGMLLCTDGTVWTCGPASANSLGRPITDGGLMLTQVPGLSNIVQIAGAASPFSYALSSEGKVFGWGQWSNYMGNMDNPTGTGEAYTSPTELTNITANLPYPIKKIVANYTATHVILEDSTLWGWGDGAQGGIGDGTAIDWPSYPNPFRWSSVPGQLLVKLPHQIAPGIKFDEVWDGGCYVYYTYARDTSGQIYCWGRGKGSVLANALKSPHAQITADKQNAWDLPWITPVDPFTITQSYFATSPDCADGTSTGSPCSYYTVPANTNPVVDAGTDQTITASTTRLEGSATDNVYVQKYLWEQVSGPNIASIDLAASPTPHISGLIEGVYVFKLTATDNGWLTDTKEVSINVGSNSFFPSNPLIKINGRKIKFK